MGILSPFSLALPPGMKVIRISGMPLTSFKGCSGVTYWAYGVRSASQYIQPSQ